MISQKLNEFQNEMDALFERKTVATYEVTRIGSIGAYKLKVSIQGLPFEVAGYGKSIEEAEVVVLSAMFEFLNKATKKDLFMTKDRNEYKEVELDRDDIQMIYDISEEDKDCDEIVDMYARDTKGYITKLDNGEFEFVIESNNYYNIHARATHRSERFVKHFALYIARSIVTPPTEIMNREAVWKNIANS